MTGFQRARRVLATFLCAVSCCLLLSCGCGSNGADTTTTPSTLGTSDQGTHSTPTGGSEPDREEPDKDPDTEEAHFLTMEDVIDQFDLHRLRRIAQSDYYDGKGAVLFPELENHTVYTSAREREIAEALERIIQTQNPFEITYSLHDVNRDGENELILLDCYYSVFAVFSMQGEGSEKMPAVALPYSFNQTVCIDVTGNFCRYNAIDNTYNLSRLTSTGALETVFEYGKVAGGGYYYYDSAASRIGVEISSEEFDRLVQANASLFENPEGRTQQSGLVPDKNYLNLSGIDRALFDNTCTVFFYRMWVTYFMDFYTGMGSDTAFSLTDVDGDKLADLIIYYPDGRVEFLQWNANARGYELSKRTYDAAWKIGTIMKDGTVTVQSLNENGETVIKTVQFGMTLGVELARNEGGHTFYVEGEMVNQYSYDAFMLEQNAKKPIGRNYISQRVVDSYFQYPLPSGGYLEELDVAVDARTVEGLLEMYRYLVASQVFDEPWIPIYPEDDTEGITENMATHLRLCLNQVRSSFYGGSTYFEDPKDAFGYAYKDLDGDGVDELILMTDYDRIISVLAIKDGVPTILLPLQYKSIWTAWIDEQGLIHAYVSPTEWDSYVYNYIYRLADGELVAELSIRRYHSLSSYCYVLRNNKWEHITPEEHDLLLDSYPSYQSETGQRDFEYMKTHLGLEFVPLFRSATPVFHNERLYSYYGTVEINLSRGETLRMIRWNGMNYMIEKDSEGYDIIRDSRNRIYRVELCSVGVWLIEVLDTGEIISAALYDNFGKG